MKKIIPFYLSILLLLAFTSMDQEIDKEQERISNTLDAWHKSSAEANYNSYFN
ncbi:hypothetical protein ACM55G_00870 [Flavobacterium sp. LB3P122]|uniref:hypothetical protein n=1 Tax=Flavobacterium algoriphilum TaxID=3398738 RepID=UPI003A850BC6